MLLNNCPFCGEIPELIKGSDRLTKIVCPPDSTCSGSRMLICYCTEDEDRAIACWNNRNNGR